MDILEKYTDSFNRMLEFNKYLIYSKKISKKEFNLLFMKSLISFSHSFGDEEDISFILEKMYPHFKGLEDRLKKFVFIGEIHKFSNNKGKLKAFRNLKEELKIFFEKNKNPLLRLRVIHVFMMSSNNLFLNSEIELRKEIAKQLKKIIEDSFSLIKKDLRNENLLNQKLLEAKKSIESLEKASFPDFYLKELETTTKAIEKKEVGKILKKFMIDASLLDKDLESPKNISIYKKLNKRYGNLLESFDYNSFNMDIANYFLYLSSVLNKIGGKLETKDIEKSSYKTKEILKEKSPQERKLFLLQLGFLNAKKENEVLSLIEKEFNLDQREKMFILYGALLAKGGIPPLGDFILKDEKKKILDLELKENNFLLKVHTNYPVNLEWSDFLNALDKISEFQPHFFPQLQSSLIIIRSLKKQPSLIKGRINIEEIARELNTSFENLLSDSKFAKDFWWFLKIFYSSFPTNQGIITEYRTTAWNWYKQIAEIFLKENIQEYEGLEKEMIYYFHDSPGPFHVEVMRSYVDFLQNNTDYSYEKVKKIFLKLNMKIPRDYAEKFGINLEKVIYNSQKLLGILEEIYSSSSGKLLFDLLKNSKTDLGLEKKIFNFLNKISKYKLSKKEDITQKMISRNELFRPEDYSLKNRLEIIGELSNLSRICGETTKKIKENKTLKNLLGIQNCLEGISYEFLFNILNDLPKLDETEVLKLLSNSFLMAKPLIPSYLKLETDYLLRELNNFSGDHKKIYALLKSSEKLVNSISSMYIDSFQPKVNSIKNIEEEVAKDFTADLIRETVLFPLSQIIHQVIINFSLERRMEKQHIVNIGENQGQLIYIPEDEVSSYNFSGKEILITEDLDSHANIPYIRGIITKSQHPPLSHMALMAREKEIPWYSPSVEEFGALKREAIKNKRKTYSIMAFMGECKIQKEKSTKRESTNIKKELLKLQYDLTSENFILDEEEYTLERVGSKAYHLNLLSKILPKQIPSSVTLSFNFFNEFLISDQNLKKEVEFLHTLSLKHDKKELGSQLEIIRKKILGSKISSSLLVELKKKIKSKFPQAKKLIIRSSTNAEDLANHSAAGVYESIISPPNKTSDAILKVFASFFTVKAWEDRRFANFDEKTCFMACLIQELVESDYSFVVHTISPKSFNKNEVLVELVSGLGESLVSGEPQFVGAAHQFKYNKKSKKITRELYRTKSIKLTSKGEQLIKPKEDIFQDKEIPLPKLLKKLFEDSIKIEKNISQLKEGGSLNLPQDIEGVIKITGAFNLLEKNKQNIYYVQARTQFIPRIKYSGVKKREKIQNKEIKKIEKVSFRISNTVKKEAYNLPKEMFKNKNNVNLINLLEESVKNVVGEGKVIIQPVGSLSYLEENNSILWEKVKDLDILLYSLESKNKYDSYLWENQHLHKIRKNFQELAKKQGLEIFPSPIKKYLGKAKHKAKKIRFKSEEITFGKNLNATSFFKRINFEPNKEKDLNKKKTNFKKLLEEYLISKKVSEEFNVYYSFKFDKESDYGNLVIASFIKAYLSGSKLIAPVFWDWNKTLNSIYEIFLELNFISLNMTKEEFLEKILKKHLEYNLIPQLEPFSIKEVEKTYPEMGKYILQGWMQAIGYYLKNGGKINKKDIILRDHIDTGSISSLLALLTFLKFESKKREDILEIIENSDKLKVPNPTQENILKRVEGDLVKPQLFLFGMKKLLKFIKEVNSEKEAIIYLREGKNGKEIINLLLNFLSELSEDKKSLAKKLSSESMGQLRKEFEKVNSFLKTKKNPVIFSERKIAACLNDKLGLKDLELKFSLLGNKTKVLVQYQEIRNNLGKLKGYRYYNVGINPLSKNPSILGLMEILSIVEMLFNDKEVQDLTRRNLWVGHSRPDIMITGPSCGSFEECSLIPPENLINLIEEFLRYKEKNDLVYTSLNYEKTLPLKFQEKIERFLYEPKTVQIIKEILKKVAETNANLELVNEANSFLLKLSGLEEKYISCGEADLRVLPITYFSNPREIKDSWWDKVPKGLNSWSSYYGDPKSLKDLSKILKENKNNLSRDLMIEKELQEFFGNRRLTNKIKLLNTKEDALRMIKEVIRLSKFLSEKSFIKEGFNLMQFYDKDYSSAKLKILELWERFNKLSYQKVLNKISKNIDKLEIK